MTQQRVAAGWLPPSAQHTRQDRAGRAQWRAARYRRHAMKDLALLITAALLLEITVATLLLG
ncbi:hypothetical protein [Nitratidesulfovibrio sp. SRB-5]|uniref:hypothetical protein n=1 Tax=Nitratidesulfovibrio sp. SRB-5 TaxID=2872636 RepID=UPI001024E2BA|nr:hypothetical protein [Nitratidesulfovibrio sp. SRB-5]MBZ2172654.1 hypothetical protein [Nitratidesulfovibrio sp. SRB-5]RXF76527.1 hypothetical protein EKK70_11370 [Desulfovibrio sp. DS-1]